MKRSKSYGDSIFEEEARRIVAAPRRSSSGGSQLIFTHSYESTTSDDEAAEEEYIFRRVEDDDWIEGAVTELEGAKTEREREIEKRIEARLETKLEERFDRVLNERLAKMWQDGSETLFDLLKTDLVSHLEHRMKEMERSWTHNPYMHLFDEHVLGKEKRREGKEADEADQGEEAENEEAENAVRNDQKSYRALVQQIAFDFRRSFFSTWRNELRAQRPFMNSMQRNAIQERIYERLHTYESQSTQWRREQETVLDRQLHDLHCQNAVLKTELSNLRFLVMKEAVSRQASPHTPPALISATPTTIASPPPLPTSALSPTTSTDWDLLVSSASSVSAPSFFPTPSLLPSSSVKNGGCV